MIFKYGCYIGDRYKRRGLIDPDNIKVVTDIPYGRFNKWNRLDVYYPVGTTKPIPTIINVHGGGYVYGRKEYNKCYCMNLAQRGFAVVNFNYRLAPKSKFPTPIIDTNQVMKWVCKKGRKYFIDSNNIFMTGDSAGAQIASQYSAIVTNPNYAKLFQLVVPKFTLRAIALNCGMYDQLPKIDVSFARMLLVYFEKDYEKHGEKLQVMKYMTKNYPPTFVMTSANDFLKEQSLPLYQRLQELGVESIYKMYGSKEQKEINHVFHTNLKLPLAKKCNDEECYFFRKYIEN